ncbi:hypothetical protein [Streptomyces sp. NPDC059564]|uniref:hypothetical protein n=1 Tax=Streptomyces sp. NPDC059564 TaxID=3346865 RepID=UPI003691C2A4
MRLSRREPRRRHAWQDRLGPEELRLAEHVLGSRLEAYGYELTGQSRPPARLLSPTTTGPPFLRRRFTTRW